MFFVCFPYLCIRRTFNAQNYIFFMKLSCICKQKHHFTASFCHLSSQARESRSPALSRGVFCFVTSCPGVGIHDPSIRTICSFFRKKHQLALRILHPVHQVDFGETSNCISKSKNAILRRGPVLGRHLLSLRIRCKDTTSILRKVT